MSVVSIYPGGTWTPLGPVTGEPPIIPSQIILHTMVGTLRGTDALFRRGGFQGVEAHFGVGGPADGILDGVVWQWQVCTRQADAQATGNLRAISIETSDGGKPETRWSPRQVAAIVELLWWLTQTYKIPAVECATPSSSGIGWHRKFKAWNPDGHSCPGDVRLKQLREVVIPHVRYLADRVIHGYLREGSRGSDVLAVQQLVGARPDGIWGPMTTRKVKTWQTRHHLTSDGIWGPASAHAAGWSFTS